MKKTTTNLDEEKSRPRGDTGEGDGGDVREDVQGISNREGDADDTQDEFDDTDEEEEEEEEENNTSLDK